MASLDTLLRRLTRQVEQATTVLEEEPDLPRIEAWRDEMARLLTRGHTAAYLAGKGSRDLTPEDRQTVGKTVRSQLSFLDNFRVEIANSNRQWRKSWNSRAKLYAEAIGASYNRGKFRMWPLPSVPGDGTTQCKGRCKCSVEVEELPGDGNADVYWRLGSSAGGPCQTCVERAAQWSPLRVRNGELL